MGGPPVSRLLFSTYGDVELLKYSRLGRHCSISAIHADGLTHWDVVRAKICEQTNPICNNIHSIFTLFPFQVCNNRSGLLEIYQEDS